MQCKSLKIALIEKACTCKSLNLMQGLGYCVSDNYLKMLECIELETPLKVHGNRTEMILSVGSQLKEKNSFLQVACKRFQQIKEALSQ